jgi:hypothetical protein
MASKPRSEWTPEYRRRVERGEAKGKSRQEARGKRAGEHIERKRREIAKTGLTSSRKASIDKFARKQANRAGSGDPDEAVKRLRQWVAEKGFDRFRELRATVDRRHRQKRERSWIEVERGGRTARAHISVGGNVADMQGDFEDFELPDMPDADDFGWLFYH